MLTTPFRVNHTREINRLEKAIADLMPLAGNPKVGEAIAKLRQQKNEFEVDQDNG